MFSSNPQFPKGASIKLAGDEVQLWRFDIAAHAGSEDWWLQVLSPDEHARAERFISQPARRQFIVTRASLRMILGDYLGTDPKKLSFRRSAKDKPGLAPPYDASGVTFNVSHAKDLALLAFSRGRDLGVDVEGIRSDLNVEDIARQFFSPHEQAELGSVRPEEKHKAFFRCWTRKEAYIKAKGEGLALPLDSFDVSLASREEHALLSTRPDASDAARWSLSDVEAGDAHVAALCVDGFDWRLRCWSGDLLL